MAAPLHILDVLLGDRRLQPRDRVLSSEWRDLQGEGSISPSDWGLLSQQVEWVGLRESVREELAAQAFCS